ncbi:MAG: hypothetical protein ABGZ36_23445, partial [Actinomycetota bacterium]
APAHMPIVDQHPAPRILPLTIDASGRPDPDALAGIIDRLRHGTRPAPVSPRWRDVQRLDIARAHETVYRRAIERLAEHADSSADEEPLGRVIDLIGVEASEPTTAAVP